jgi:hypothetical protein
VDFRVFPWLIFPNSKSEIDSAAFDKFRPRVHRGELVAGRADRILERYVSPNLSDFYLREPNTGGDKPRRYFLDSGSSVGAAVYPRPQGLECRLIRLIYQRISSDSSVAF